MGKYGMYNGLGKLLRAYTVSKCGLDRITESDTVCVRTVSFAVDLSTLTPYSAVTCLAPWDMSRETPYCYDTSHSAPNLLFHSCSFPDLGVNIHRSYGFQTTLSVPACRKG